MTARKHTNNVKSAQEQDSERALEREIQRTDIE